MLGFSHERALGCNTWRPRRVDSRGARGLVRFASNAKGAWGPKRADRDVMGPRLRAVLHSARRSFSDVGSPRREVTSAAETVYGFSATTLSFLQKYTGVPCMRATLRAVLAARRIPRPTPAAKLSGFFGFLRCVVMGRACPSVAEGLRIFVGDKSRKYCASQ